jgi:uncharacterized membrane protein (DUF485 family)
VTRKEFVLRLAIGGLVAIVAAACVVLYGKYTALHQFDADPSCTAMSPELPVAVPSGACVRRQIRISSTRAASVGRSGSAHYIVLVDDNGRSVIAQIVREDSVFVQMFHPGDATFAVYYQDRPIRIAFRQYWLTTEDDPHRLVLKTEILFAIGLVLFAIIAWRVYLRTS